MKWPLFLLTLVLAGCDSGESTEPRHVAAATQPKPALEITSVAPLIARHPTHLAVDSRSNIYWIQETESRDDLVFGINNESGVPEALSQLTSRRMLDLLHQPTGDGNIQSIVVGSDENLYLYFLGGNRRSIQAALVQYSPKTRTARLLADTAQIMSSSGMGKSLDLARGTLLASSTDLWLWLRQPDAYVLLRVLPLASLAHPCELRQPFDSVRIPAGGPKVPGLTATPAPGELRLTSELEDLSAGDNQKLFYIDRQRGVIWHIDSKGAAAVSHSLQGIPNQLSSALIDSKGRMHVTAGVGEAISVLDAGDPNQQALSAVYPALLSFDGIQPADALSVISRAEIKSPPNMTLETMQVTTWAIDPVGGGFVAFDGASGDVLRFKQMQK